METNFAKILVLVLVLLCVGAVGLIPACKQLSDSPEQLTRGASDWDALVNDLGTALQAKEEARIVEATQKMIMWLGPNAGNPEVSPSYYLPIDKGTPAMSEVVQLWDEIEKRARQDLVWRHVPDGNPKHMSSGLRAGCRPIIAFAALARVRPDYQDEYLQLVRDGADYVLKLQLDNGLFPFPDLRSRHQLLGPMVGKLIQNNPQALVRGWIVDDSGRGDLQYDNGICGVAMLEAYLLTNESEYLDSAQAASDWALSQPLSINWNYTAFSVWLLARFSKITGKSLYLDEAYVRFHLGILPGQLPDGHWFDPHNARLVYHGILVRGILELDQALLPGDPRKDEVRESLISALDYAAAEITSQGASSVSTTTEVLSRALPCLGHKIDWEEALNINVNASLDIFADPKAPVVGLYLADYLTYKLIE